MLGDVNKLVFKSLLTTPSNVLPLHLKQTFPPIIWIFTEGEGDGIKSRLFFKIFSTLQIFFSSENTFEIFTSKHDEGFFTTNQIVYFISKILEIVRIPLNQFTEEKIGHWGIVLRTKSQFPIFGTNWYCKIFFTINKSFQLVL